jgi:hypothetical protein
LLRTDNFSALRGDNGPRELSTALASNKFVAPSYFLKGAPSRSAQDREQ